MKLNKNIIVSLVLLVVMAAIYRIIPSRPYGFAPQIAMALFGGALFVKDKKWAFLLPILSMFISDALYQILYVNGLSQTRGFYSGQITNYLLFAGLVVIGFGVKTNKIMSIVAGVIAAPTAYFLASNLLVWASGGGYHHPKTFDGMLACLADGLPFYQGSIAGTAVFAGLLFGSYYVIQQRNGNTVMAK
jgi:uncharacterized membrane protein YhhN